MIGARAGVPLETTASRMWLARASAKPRPERPLADSPKLATVSMPAGEAPKGVRAPSAAKPAQPADAKSVSTTS